MSDPLASAFPEESEVSFAEIYSTLCLNDELILTLDPISLESVKTGLKNYKAKLAKKMKDEGLVPDSSTLAFVEYPSKEFKGCICLKIILEKKGTFIIKKMEIPEKLDD